MASASEILKETAHRPFSHPKSQWVMRQSWDDLLFAHWKVPFNKLRPHVPAIFELDTYEGNCWVGVVPFAMRHVRPRYAPSLPLLSHFLELNLRTYVKDPRNGQGGVYFFSLDCSNPIAVEIACKAYHLPYYNALMKMSRTAQTEQSEEVHYQSVRVHQDSAIGEREPQLKFQATYAPVGEVFYSAPGSLEAFLTERYCLLLEWGGQLKRGDIHHPRWPLQLARAEIGANTIGDKYGFDLSTETPLLHYSRHIDTVEWPLR